jgi:hypothetical protein
LFLLYYNVDWAGLSWAQPIWPNFATHGEEKNNSKYNA